MSNISAELKMTNKAVPCLILLVGLVLGLGTTVARAQTDFRPGYVVLPSGDTLRGEIDMRGVKRMSQKCLFRPQVGGTPTQYAPSNLKAYGQRGGVRYEACLLPAPATTAVFMQVLVAGRATLYSFEDDDNRTHYFFRQGNGELAELVQRVQINRDGPVPVQEATFPFRQVLAQAFADCLAVQPMLPKAMLVYTELVAIFTRYNDCNGVQALTKVVRVRGTVTHLGALIGMQQATTTLDDNGEVELASNLRPVVGVGLLIEPAAFNSRLALRFEALYQMQLLEGDYQRTNFTISSTVSKKASVSLKTVRVPLLLRYTLLAGRIRPYVQAGVETAILLDDKQAMITETTPNLGGASGSSVAVRSVPMRSIGIGPTVGVGLLVPTGTAGALQLETRVNILDSASQAGGQLGGPATISFLLGYNLGQFRR
jgi:hypothetical protein